jgi:hypothetical protein
MGFTNTDPEFTSHLGSNFSRDYCLLECDLVQSGINLPAFQENLLVPTFKLEDVRSKFPKITKFLQGYKTPHPKRQQSAKSPQSPSCPIVVDLLFQRYTG